MTGLALATRGLSIGYHGRALRAIPDLEIGPGVVWLVTGPNGCGKTTLLKTLAGLLQPVAGRVAPAPRRGPGGAVFVHSAPVLFTGTLRQNLDLAARSDAELLEAASRFGLAGQLGQPAYELSHGMRQRTALVRAILTRPALLLLDEPEGGLDEPALRLWRNFAASAASDASLTLVVAAHRPAGLEGVPTKAIALE